MYVLFHLDEFIHSDVVEMPSSSSLTPWSTELHEGWTACCKNAWPQLRCDALGACGTSI